MRVGRLAPFAVALMALLSAGCLEGGVPEAAGPGRLAFSVWVDEATLADGSVEAILRYANPSNGTLTLLPFGSCDGRGGFELRDAAGNPVADGLPECGAASALSSGDLLRVGPWTSVLERRTVAVGLAAGDYVLRATYVAPADDALAPGLWSGTVSAEDGFAL